MNPAPPEEKKDFKPRSRNITDWGYGDRTRGWYDITGQGVRNDYCRWVGDYPNVWFSAALAGADEQYTGQEVKIDENLPHDPYDSADPYGEKPQAQQQQADVKAGDQDVKQGAAAAVEVKKGPASKARQSKTLTDWGYADRTRGWYDLQNTGYRNDYCRWVGDYPNVWFSAALAGSDDQYTPRDFKIDEDLPHDPYKPDTVDAAQVEREAAKGIKSRNPNIRDWGYGNMHKGWYDIQNQGVRNDYCRYVGDAPNIWFSCALAGADSEYTPIEQKIDPQLPHDPIHAPPRSAKITDWGYGERERGWYDIQGLGVRNDYCRWVGDHPDIWFSAALAGAESEYTPREFVIDPSLPHDPYAPEGAGDSIQAPSQ